ncbi:MAG: biotin--[acetyl-CoA-carboxylase] ligase [Alkalispirochaetaceae bacterium]
MSSSELSRLRSPFSGGEVIHLLEVDSTMRYARRLMESKRDLHGTVIVADHQTAGVGRGRESAWEDEAGANLLVTVILRRGEGETAEESLRLSLLTGLGVCETLDAYIAERATLKWPNDVLIRGKKACGILCEQGGGYARVGIGINLNARSVPERTRIPATSVALETGSDYSRRTVLLRLLERLAARLSLEELPTEELNGRLAFRGRPVRCELFRRGSAEEIEGILRGIDRSGALLLEMSGGIEELHAARLLSLRAL